jgi:hypothetical protein
MKLNANFDEFLAAIEPTASTRETAISAHSTLRDRLANDADFAKLHVETFLSGSYKRSTAIQPIKDTDIVVIINEDSTRLPLKVLGELKQVLDKYYPAKSASQRRSIRIDLTKISLDVIPALAPNGADNPLLIPDRELKRWIATNPKGHTAWTSRLNAATTNSETDRGRFVPLVKMLKWWKKVQLPEAKRPKGFTLECIAGQHHDPTARDWADVFIASLERINSAYGIYKVLPFVPGIPDPGLRGQNIPTGLTVSEFQAFLKKVNESLAVAKQARDSTDPQASAALWRKIFGNHFPDLGSSDDSGGGRTVEGPRGPSVFNRSPRDVREAPPFA